MERYRLKNIIITILLLLNFALIFSLAIRKNSEQMAHRRTQEQLVELFAADGMELDGNMIPDGVPSQPLALSRDARKEREVAEFFLGEALQYEDQGGGIYSYTSAHGVALFRGDGSFDVVGAQTPDSMTALCETFCKEFSYGDPVFLLDKDDSGTVTTVYQYDDMPVFNCAVTFNLDRGTLQTLSGTLLPESGITVVSDRELLSAPAALTAFQKMRRETGAVVSAVTEIYPCYRLQSTTAAPMLLTPVWCIVTDTSRYYVNCMSGAVTTG